ncbi:hypothetical protein U6N30_03950 [Blastococcus brunescens]|uniref:Uncharacterized protein n=1 Tax=Blastococcus brunescens TaxID=1564165 RepID=A0ABZ1B263_9ACTN|nr:hypothetical protein [Blastococcus sp. BMG 8361]WRL64899.1 hypothetical protein U6N30_03950 [Blastococcus sp. BMG 8361]
MPTGHGAESARKASAPTRSAGRPCDPEEEIAPARENTGGRTNTRAMPVPTAPAVERSTAPSPTERTATSPAAPPCSPSTRRTAGSFGCTPPGTAVSVRAASAHTPASTALSARHQPVTTTVFAARRRVRRGAAARITSTMPEANSVVTARTPSTTSTSCPNPKPVRAAWTAMSARAAEAVLAAASHPAPPTASR